MKQLHLFAVAVFLLCFSSILLAQRTSNGTGGGKWSLAATWSGGNIPTGSESITIAATDSIYIDVPVTITGTLKNLSGKIGIFDSSKVIFGTNSLYEHAADAGSLPKAVWGTGSTCLLTGVTAKSPSNGNQNFYNLTWNCPGQTASLNLGMGGNTIGGTLRVINTSGSFYFRLTSNTVLNGRKTITINGDVLVDSTAALFTSTGSGAPNDTITVIVKGNVISKGTFQLANGSAAMCNWFVAGDFKGLGGAITTNSTATLPDSLIFNGTGKQLYVRTGGVGGLSNVHFGVRQGAIVDLDTNTSGGASSVTLSVDSGATIVTAHARGMKGNFNSAGTIILSPASNFTYDGTVAQVDSILPAAVRNLTINNPAGFTLSVPTTIKGILKLEAGVLDNTVPFTLAPGASIVTVAGSVKVPYVSVAKYTDPVPQSFYVMQNYPNPFNPSTAITFGLPKDSYVSAKVFNLIGQEVATLVDGHVAAGMHTLSFNATKLGSGVYFCRIQAGSSVETRRMILAK